MSEQTARTHDLRIIEKIIEGSELINLGNISDDPKEGQVYADKMVLDKNLFPVPMFWVVHIIKDSGPQIAMRCLGHSGKWSRYYFSKNFSAGNELSDLDLVEYTFANIYDAAKHYLETFNPESTDETFIAPCPFCGSDGEVTVGGFGERQVTCTNKGCQAGLGGSCWQKTDEEAISAWNRRSFTFSKTKDDKG